MKSYRKVCHGLLWMKSIGYRLISFILQTIILWTCSIFRVDFLQTSLFLTAEKTITYWVYDYLFVKKFKISKDEGFVLWFTGPSGVGKSTLADALKNELKKYERRIERLDGDIVRQSLCEDLGFSQKDRDTNIKRVTFVAKMLSKNGVGVLASFISPYRKIRQYVREQTTNFIEVHLIASKYELMKRDPKGLYKKAKEGKIKNLTGYDGVYETPYNAEISINTEKESIEDSVKLILNYLKKRELI